MIVYLRGILLFQLWETHKPSIFCLSQKTCCSHQDLLIPKGTATASTTPNVLWLTHNSGLMQTKSLPQVFRH